MTEPPDLKLPNPTCAACSNPIDLADRHVSLNWHVESAREPGFPRTGYRHDITVHEADALAHLHIGCVRNYRRVLIAHKDKDEVCGEFVIPFVM